MGIKLQKIIINALLLFTVNVISQFVNKRPWPTYSLHNMPRTGFTCQDKILGGYYADPETQCQMFHVCVKVAGVGVQDFRFLCPNGTAFDQEAQICADWGDVDCEQATLYYSSDNFDLYRLGSGFESKRAPLAEEEEAPFHLQRAETNDIRRSKQTVVDQRIRPENPGGNLDFNKRKSFADANFELKKPTNYQQGYDEQQYQQKIPQKIVTTKKPTYIKPTTSQITTKSENYQQEDELLKGSHSSNFFNNRNNGKEDDLVDFNNEPKKTQPQRTRQRGRNTNQNQNRRNYYNSNNILTSPNKPNNPSTTAAPPQQQSTTTTIKPFLSDTKGNSQTLTLQASFRTADLNHFNGQEQFRITQDVTSTTQANFPYDLTPTKPQTQQNIQPTTYNPSNKGYKIKSTTSRYEDFGEVGKSYNNQNPQVVQNQNPFYNTQFENKASEYNFDNFNQNHQPFARKNIADNNRNSNDFYNSAGVNNTAANLQVYNSNGNDFSANKDFKKIPTRNSERRRMDQYEKPQNLRNSQQNNDRNRQETKLNNRGEEVKKSNNFGYNAKVSEIPNLSVRTLDPQKINSAFQNQSIYTDGDNQNRFKNNQFNRRTDSNYQKSIPEQKIDKPYEQQQQQISRGTPTPFTSPPIQQITRNTSPSPIFNDFVKQSPFPQNSNVQQNGNGIPIEQTPRGFSRSTPFNSKSTTVGFPSTTRQPQTNDYDRYQTVSRINENFTPSTATKKFSTLVPKDQYYPTTFKPTTYKKSIDNFNGKIEKSSGKSSSFSYLPTSGTTSTTTQRTINQQQEPDEDDGQYHPELYETDFPRNQQKHKQKIIQNSFNQYQQQHQQKQQPQQQSSDFSDEDEFLKTAHSLNIAAGANQLRAEKAKQSSPNNLFKSSSSSSSVPVSTTTRKPSTPIFQQTTPSLPASKSPKLKNKRPTPNEDTSYDYAYYDSNNGNPHDYAEYDVISEFGKTKKH